MPIVKITGRGLASIAFAVALLWGCFIAERITAREAYAERARIMRDLHLLQKKQQQPSFIPLQRYGHPVRSTAG